jgi:uncharacterized oxidoreductase
MSSSINTILIIGGTSGIGEACARRFHSVGKRVIITGRRQNRLDEIRSSLMGVKTYTFDMMDLSAIPTHIEKLFKEFPDIDTVWVNGGIQYSSDVKDPASSTDEKIIDEVTTNITAPFIITRHVVPLLQKRSAPTTFMITSSGLGFIPVGSMFPVYCPTKAAIHLYMVGLRQALRDTNVNVIEIVPPFVGDTELGGLQKNDMKGLPVPMPLDEFVEVMFEQLGSGEDFKEIAAGSAIPRVKAWRDAMGPTLAKVGGG